MTITNDDSSIHNFKVPGLDLESGNIDPGESTTVTLVASVGGSFEFFCDIPGHKEAGMVGSFIVASDEVPTTAAATSASAEEDY